MSIAGDWARGWQMIDLKRPRFHHPGSARHHGDDGTLAIRQEEVSAEQGAALGRWILDTYGDTP